MLERRIDERLVRIKVRQGDLIQQLLRNVRHGRIQLVPHGRKVHRPVCDIDQNVVKHLIRPVLQRTGVVRPLPHVILTAAKVPPAYHAPISLRTMYNHLSETKLGLAHRTEHVGLGRLLLQRGQLVAQLGRLCIVLLLYCP